MEQRYSLAHILFKLCFSFFRSLFSNFYGYWAPLWNPLFPFFLFLGTKRLISQVLLCAKHNTQKSIVWGLGTGECYLWHFKAGTLSGIVAPVAVCRFFPLYVLFGWDAMGWDGKRVGVGMGMEWNHHFLNMYGMVKNEMVIPFYYIWYNKIY